VEKDDFSKLGYKKKVPPPRSAPGSPQELCDDDEDWENTEKSRLKRTNSSLLIDLKELALDGASRNASPVVGGVPSVLSI
jgi:hypothetical protein